MGTLYTQIPGGASSIPYVLPVNPDPGTSLAIFYTYSCDLAYLQKGFYNDAGTTWDKGNATILPGGNDHMGIDLSLLTGNRITGQVSLPAGEFAPAEGVNIRLYFNNRNGNAAHYKDIYIQEGRAATPYGIALQPDATANWEISYAFSGKGPYLPQGYYSASGTTWNASDATLLAGNSAHPGSDLTLLAGNRITGRLSLPAGEVAPAKGLRVRMAVEDENGTEEDWQHISIKRGDASVNYVLAVIPDAARNWVVSYSHVYENTRHYRSGFYNSVATTWNKTAATKLAGGTDHSGIDLGLLTNRKISGQISLPPGDAAPANGIAVSIAALRQQTSVAEHQTTVTIEVGNSTASYTLWVAPYDAEKWLLKYSYHGFRPYMKNAYYAVTGTTGDKAAATLLAGDQDHSGINLELLSKLRFSGTVSLPPGEVAPAGGIGLFVDFDNLSTWVDIDEGEFSVPYELWVPVDPSLTSTVSYRRQESGAYLVSGYYASTGTTWENTQGELLRADSDHPGIDLMLLTGDRISGTVSLPEGQLASARRTGLIINSRDIHSPKGNSAHISIAEGESAVQYVLAQIPNPAAQWRVSYRCQGFGACPYVHEGFYAQNGTFWDPSKASLLEGGVAHAGINLRLIKDIPDSCALADEIIPGPILYEEDYHCSTESSITAGSPQGVAVGKGAHVLYSAPQIELLPGFSINGGVFSAGNNLLP